MRPTHLLTLLFCVLFTTGLTAQTTEQEARDDLDYYNGNRNERTERRGDRFTDNLWYGAGAQLQFQGGNNFSFFLIGVSPSVGYKLNNIISVGPRGALAYNRFRFATNAGDEVENFVTWSAGLFARAKVFGQFFVHAEYSAVNERQQNQFTGELQSITRAIPFAGGGLNQGGGPGQMGFEILLLFRLTSADRLNDSPFEIRSGINYNF